MSAEPLSPSDSEADEVELPPDAPPICDTLDLPGVDNRDKALPIRPGDLTRLLVAQPGLAAEDRERLARFGPRLGAHFHQEFFRRLRALKEAYAPLDPDSDYANIAGHTRERTDTLDDEFLELLDATLERANFRALRTEIIREAVAAPNELGLSYVPDFSQFEHLRVYARGFTKILRVSRNARTRFRRRTIVLDAYQRMVVVLKFKDGLAKKIGPYVRTDKLYLRMFKDVPHVDMEMHLPEQGARVKMRWLDKAQIASPLLVGLPTAAAKLLLAAVISPLLLGTAIVAPLSAGVNSFFGFHRAKQKHLSHMIRSLYYLTLANNGSVLSRLIDAAEEEEYKETLLAYFFLWRNHDGARGFRVDALDDRIEAFLKDLTGCEINFEISDALNKLYRLGLARLDADGRLVATPLDEALAHLECLWDRSFREG
ncbi:MAG TPA: DUF3754 domain-containing protein [Isosphaeraceae bacterium]|jgi:hypothetical protein